MSQLLGAVLCHAMNKHLTVMVTVITALPFLDRITTFIESNKVSCLGELVNLENKLKISATPAYPVYEPNNN